MSVKSPAAVCFVVLPLLAGLLGLNGCMENSPSGPPATGNLSLSVWVPTSRAKTSGTIALSSAKVLIKKIAFHSALSDDTADVKSGAVVVSLRLDGSPNEVILADIRPGVYDRIRFQLHKPEDGELVGDPEFAGSMSGSDRYCAVAKGVFDGASFDYRSRQNATQEILLAAPVVVEDGGRVNVTLVVNPSSWFRFNDAVLNPMDPSNADRIDENIKASFEGAYRDNDHDGSPD